MIVGAALDDDDEAARPKANGPLGLADHALIELGRVEELAAAATLLISAGVVQVRVRV